MKMYKLRHISLALLLICAFAKASDIKRDYCGHMRSLADSIYILPADTTALIEILELRAFGKEFGIAWDIESPSTYKYITVRHAADNDDILHNYRIIASHGLVSNGTDSIVSTVIIHPKKLTNKGETTAWARFRRDGIIFKCGTASLDKVFTLPDVADPTLHKGFIARGHIDVTKSLRETQSDPALHLQTSWTDADLDRYFNSGASDSNIEGRWKYLDRETDKQYTTLGGIYRIGVVARDPDTYDIIYLDGAKKNPDFWKTGMLKGVLRCTPYSNNFDLVWFDALGNEIDMECNASIDSEKILTLEFTLLKSSLRFFQEPMDK